MGLDTTHDAWHGPYSNFNNWREYLAEKVGFNLREMIGFGGSKEWTAELMEHDLYPLLNHSDCDGILTVEDCKRVSIGLQNMIDYMSQVKFEFEEYQLRRCIKFRNGCGLAISKNEPIKFQ